MGTELQMLLWSIVLGLVTIGVAATLSTAQRGLAWNAGPRDELAKPLTGAGGRLERASRRTRGLSETSPTATILSSVWMYISQPRPRLRRSSSWCMGVPG